MISANIAKVNFDVIHRSLRNLVRNFVIHYKSTNFNPEAVQLNRLESIELMCLMLFEALFENFVVDKVIVYLRDVICITRSQK